jgi:hypothetical protein
MYLLVVNPKKSRKPTRLELENHKKEQQLQKEKIEKEMWESNPCPLDCVINLNTQAEPEHSANEALRKIAEKRLKKFF